MQLPLLSGQGNPRGRSQDIVLRRTTTRRLKSQESIHRDISPIISALGKAIQEHLPTKNNNKTAEESSVYTSRHCTKQGIAQHKTLRQPRHHVNQTSTLTTSERRTTREDIKIPPDINIARRSTQEHEDDPELL